MQGEQEKHKFRVYLAELLPDPQPFAITDLCFWKSMGGEILAATSNLCQAGVAVSCG